MSQIRLMAATFIKESTGTQPSLLPENILERIAPNHPVRLVNEVVDNLDITSIIKKHKGGGASSFHPRMMVKVLFYSYLCNVYSCRKIERALQKNIPFIGCQGLHPDFRTINYFTTIFTKSRNVHSKITSFCPRTCTIIRKKIILCARWVSTW